MCNCTSENLEIPGLVLTHHPGMTEVGSPTLLAMTAQTKERTMPWPEPVTLSGPHAQLKPLSHDQIGGLTEAGKDGELGKLWYTALSSAEGMGKEIDRRLGLQAAGAMLPVTVFDAGGRIAGMTTYMNVDALNRRVE